MGGIIFWEKRGLRSWLVHRRFILVDLVRLSCTVGVLIFKFGLIYFLSRLSYVMVELNLRWLDLEYSGREMLGCDSRET
jgi:hypothetical protein